MNPKADISAVRPFLRIAPLMVAGIVAADTLRAPLWPTLSVWVLCLAAGIVWRRTRAGNLCAALLVVLTAMLLATLHTPRPVMPHEEELAMEGRVVGLPERRGGRLQASVKVDRFRATDDPKWHTSGEKIMLSADTSAAAVLVPGGRIAFTGRIRSFVWGGADAERKAAGYAALMYRRGFTGRCRPADTARIASYGSPRRTPLTVASRLRSAAAERLGRLPLSERAREVCLTMSLGLRSGLPPQLRENYSRTGAAHLLAVSGLHVGIVAMLANLLLGLLPLLRGGHRLKNALAVAAIWLYAALAGLSPSTVRAAGMFSGVQIALASSRPRNGLNVMLGTAVVMLALDPNQLYDISFQLSFAAVLGIAAFFGPIYRRLRCRWKGVNLLCGTIIVSIAAGVATAPLVSLRFGSLPLAATALSPVLMLTSTAIVFCSLLWILVPIPALDGMFAWILQHAADGQNAVVGFCASQSWAALPVELSGWETAAAYALLVCAGVWAAGHNGKSDKLPANI